MKAIALFAIFVLLIGASVPCALSSIEDTQAELTPQKNISQNISKNMSMICDQPYTLCTTAICVSSQSDPSKVLCSCPIENGVSAGVESCSARSSVGMYMNERGELMIKAGVPVGQITSTYSFYNSAPTKGGAIDPNTTTANYTGNIYLKPCQDGDWASCLDQPCTVLPEDPTADINKDRKASGYAVCECNLVNNSSEWYMGVQGIKACENTTICHDYVWSAAHEESMKPGISALKKYLQDNPGADPAQEYAMGFCPECTNCSRSDS
jgi:hypothetical protein